jgi:hypothetical protein
MRPRPLDIPMIINGVLGSEVATLAFDARCEYTVVPVLKYHCIKVFSGIG